MYTVWEYKDAVKTMKKMPLEIKRNYLAWKRIVELEGPSGLRLVKGFHDEALEGEWKGFRSSRLNRQWRVIYQVLKDEFMVCVIEINPHQY